MTFELQRESNKKIKNKVPDLFEKAIIRVNDCMERNSDCKIQIVDGCHSGGLKELVVIVIEDYFLDHKGEKWETGNINEDINAENLASYLNKIFPKEGPWVVNASQSAFDIYALKAKIAVELKSAKGKQKNIVGNATLYPTEARIRDVVPKKRWDNNWTKEYLNTLLDVVVVFVSKKRGKLDDYFITDGSYWGIELKDYLSCRSFFSLLNQRLNSVLEDMLIDHPNQEFIKRMLTDKYGGLVKLQVRKLISYKNPLGE